MKRIIWISLCGIFLFFSSTSHGQVGYLYSELTSHMRGNRSVNLSAQYNSNRWIHGLGLDYYYGIKAPERAFDGKKMNIGINYKTGVVIRNNEKYGSHIVGINAKYARFNMFQRDSDLGESWAQKDHTFYKKYSKFVIMGIYQYEMLLSEKVYIAFQAGLGKPYLYDISVKKIAPRGLGVTKDWDFNDISEHGYHRNENGPFTNLAIQFNISVGYKIFGG